MLVDDVIARIAAVTELAGWVEGAAELSSLVKTGSLPQRSPAAFVLPLGLRGGAADAATDIFRQSYEETVSIVLVVESAGDPSGGAALLTINDLVWKIIPRIVGWAPANQVGVFRLARGALLSVNAGTVIYQLDFAIQDQLRIAT